MTSSLEGGSALLSGLEELMMISMEEAEGSFWNVTFGFEILDSSGLGLDLLLGARPALLSSCMSSMRVMRFLTLRFEILHA